LVPRSNIRKDARGDKVKRIEHNTKPASTPKTGRFALLRGSLRINGSGALKLGRGSGVGGRGLNHGYRLILLFLTPILGAMAFTAAPALAAGPPEAPHTEAPSPLTATTATFNGVLNPGVEPQAGVYEFVYKKVANGPGCEGESATAVGIVTGLPKQSVSEPVSLEPNTEYAVCLAMRNAAEELRVGNAVPFTTKAAPPAILSESATGVKGEEATLNAQIDPNNQETTYSFEYASTEVAIGTLGATTVAGGGPLSGFSPEGQTASVTATGLTPHTTYYYRALAENTKGEKAAPGKVESFTTGPLEAPTEGLEAKPIAETEATLHGVLNPGGPVNPASYEFIYRQSGGECEHEGTAEKATPVTVAPGLEKEAVSTPVTELLPGMPYTFCLRESNEAGEVALSSPVTFMTTAVAPAIESESEFAMNVAATSATLGAQIDPGGAATTYHFEYIDQAGYEAALAESALDPYAKGVSTPESASIGAGDTARPAEAHIQELAAHTIYHYRVVATNALSPAGVPGPDRTFTTQPAGGEVNGAGGLPDGREWELVSPAQDEGAAVEDFHEYPLQAAAEGGAITYQATGAIEPGQQGNGDGNRVLSWRGPSGWSTRDLDIPRTERIFVHQGAGEEYKFFSADLAYGIVEPRGSFDPLLSPEASERTPYLRSDFAGAEMTEACASSCYRPLLTAADVPPGTKFGGRETGGGTLANEAYVRVLAVTPDLSSVVLNASNPAFGTVALTQPASPSGDYVWTAGRIEAIPGSFLAVTDGHVFFAEAGGIGVLDIAGGETSLLAPEAAFVIASGDGSRVFFTRESHYFQVEVESGRVTDLTPGIEVQINQVVAHSQDGSYLYFDGLVDGGEGGYALSESNPEWRVGVVPGMPGLTQTVTKEQPAGVGASSDGRYLAFTSRDALTGYDNTGAHCVPEEGEKGVVVGYGPGSCLEVYLYDADTGKLRCVSCDPTGGRPSGESYLEGSYGSGYQPRDVLDDGRVFFNSRDALVPRDVNGAFDVYQYEPAALGSCAPSSGAFTEGLGGCVSLLSGGASAQPSTFLDASESGGDVFFRSAAKLSTTDTGSAFVVYDAHECTSAAPCFSSTVPPPPCTTEASCKASPTPQPSIYGAPASATFSGAGNMTPAAVTVTAKAKLLTRAQKLANALRACRKDKKKSSRAGCEKQARAKYGPTKAKKKIKATKSAGDDRRAAR
jgi:hypothetical protein